MHLRRVSAWIAALSLTGCADHSFAPRRSVPLESSVLVGLSEQLPEHALLLECRTAQEYPCVNYALDAQAHRDGSAFDLQFNDVVIPAVCATAIGPARAELELGGLGEGEHALTLRSRGDRLTGTLHVNPSAYTVDLPDGAVAFPEPILRRIPEHTWWGFFGYATPERRTEAEAVLRQIQALGAAPAALAAGHYNVRLRERPGDPVQGDAFVVDASGTPDYGANTGYYHVMPFAVSYSGDPAAIRELVARVGRTHGDAIQLRVFSTRGHAYYSWVLGR